MAFNIGQMLADRARLLGKKEGFVANNLRLTFDEMNRRSNAIAHFLIGKKFAPGDKIAIMCKNNADFVTVFFGAAKIGVICVAVNYKLQAKELIAVFNHSRVKAVMFDEDLTSLIEQTKSETTIDYYLTNSTDSKDNSAYIISNIVRLYSVQEPEYKTFDHDPILMIYTSGTTGSPKAAMISHLNLLSSSVSLSSTITCLEWDRFLLVIPMFHIAGLIPLMTNIHTGATTILLEDFEPISAWKIIEKERVTTMMSVPEMLASLIKALDIMKPNLSTLRTITCGAASVPPQIIVVFKQFGIPVQQVYGITEFSGSLTIWRSEFDDEKIGSKGKPVMYSKLKVVSLDTGEELPPYENGEIICSGPQTFLGYYEDEEGTMQVLKNGWYYTGDIGYVDDNGFVYIVDRLKDIIVSNGEKIYSAEIEEVLMKHPAVAKVGVIGVPDSYFGEIPRAYIQLVRGMTVSKEELIDYCRKDLASYKVIKEIVFVDRLPRNTVGKLLKEELKKLQPH